MKTINKFSRVKKPGRKTIITHDGLCHSDDTMAVALLTLIFRKLGKKYKIIRTRDESQIPEKGDLYIVDVFNTTLDHHSEPKYLTVDNSEKREAASIGLLWWGARDLIMRTFQIDGKAHYDIYLNLIKEIDKTDNTGEMNPFNYLFNSIRNSSSDDEKRWKKCLKFCQDSIKALIESQKKNMEEGEIYKKLPILKIETSWGHLPLRYSESRYVQKRGMDEYSDGIIYPDPNGKGFMIKLFGYHLNANKLSDEEKKEVLFIHRSRSLCCVKNLSILSKLLP